MATQRRILEPSDDPSASSRVLTTTQDKSINEQFTRNAQQAQSSLALHESVLGSVSDILQEVRVLAVNAGNATLDATNRGALVTELKGHYAQLLSLANTKDGSGKYMFSGFQGDTLPFTETSPGTVAYNGDQGQRLIQINASRQVPISSTGSDVFQRIHNGNGTFVTADARSAATGLSTNTGTGLIDPGLVLNTSNWNASNKNYTIKFDVSAAVPPVTTYDIVDNVTNLSVLTGAAPAGAGPYPRTYTSGTTISLKNQGAEPVFDFGGQVTISGAPATGDTFTIKNSTNQDLFTTINNLIVSLQQNQGNTAITNNNSTALSNIDLVQENILKARTNTGALQKEVDGQLNTNSDLDLQYTTTISNLQDLDVAKAASDLVQKQTALDAAQKSFLKIQGLSLFNYLQ
jgi:flagellar hook-associated protein 3 FlgL